MKYIFIGVNCSINLFLLLYYYRAGGFQDPDPDWKQILLTVAFVISGNLINFVLYRWLKPSFTFFEILIYVITTLLIWTIMFFVYMVLAIVIFFSSFNGGSLFQN